MEGFALLPAAITMVAGPQIISAVVLATSRDAKRNSLAYLTGVTAAVLLGTAISIGLLAVASGLASQSDSEGTGSRILTYALVALLAYVAFKAVRDRETAEPPKWLRGLQEAEPRSAMKLGFMLFLFMPTDIAMMLSVAAFITKNDLSYWSALPFFLLTLLLISLPFLAYLALGDRAEEALPAVRDWMNRYSWAINVGICLFFIYSLLS